MRHSTRALLSVLLVTGCCQCALAESSSWRWWPFGDKEEPMPAAAPATTAPPTITPTPSPTLRPSDAITPVGPQLAVPSPMVPQYAPPTQAPSPQLPPVTRDADRPPLIESPFPKFNWPKMPEWSFPKPRTPQIGSNRSQLDNSRNAWVEKNPTPPKPSPLQALSDGAHRVGNRTRAAWRKTVDAVTPGAEDHRTGSHVASRDVKPPLWKRMFGSQEPEPRGPQTIPEWMAQDRVDP